MIFFKIQEIVKIPINLGQKHKLINIIEQQIYIKNITKDLKRELEKPIQM